MCLEALLLYHVTGSEQLSESARTEAFGIGTRGNMVRRGF